MVEQGKLFGFMDTLSAIGYSIQSDFYGLLKIGGKFDFDWQLSIATRNDQPILGHIFEKIVASLTRQQQSIVNNWVSSIELVHVSNQKLVLQVVAFFSAILIIAVFRNRQLQRHQAEITEKNKALAEINSQLQLQKNEIQHLADHDFLTGLPNRKNFSSLFKHAISIANRKHYSLAVLFLDLDRFKAINDSFGHHVGDEMLKALSQRLQQNLRESDIIARIGGDEFLIILEAIDDYHYPGVVAKKILDTIRQPIIVSEHAIHNTASIGIAFFPDDGKDVNALIKNADSAMYLAKEKGKDNYQYYTFELSAQIERHMFIEHALRVYQ
jgi:diguanylate cyclase (GGDEF)-like protein